jgi:hypothetical protein
MHAYSYRTPSKHIYIDTGSEGPSHDPYSYTEYTVQPRADDAPTAVLHMGLAFWYEVDGKRTGQGEELRVNIGGSTEATAYYTEDLDDARSTGILMAQRNGGTVQ